MLELTAGEVVTYFDSPLGFRHGPKSVLDGDTLVVVYVSTDPYTRRYDLDIIAEIRAQLGQDAVVVISTEPHSRRRTGPLSCCRASTASTTLLLPSRTWCSPSTSRCSPRWNAVRRRTIPFPSGEVSRVVQGRHHLSDDGERRVTMMARYLGVDGGGSKTALALIDDAGTSSPGPRRRRPTTSTTASTSSKSLWRRALRTSARRPESRRPISTRPSSGIPGYGEASGDIEQLDAVPAGVLGHDRYSCDNDMVCGWAGSLAGEDGINVISGTGSMTYGERQGVGHRVGGWGELFGDEGSAYWIATQGLTRSAG